MEIDTNPPMPQPAAETPAAQTPPALPWPNYAARPGDAPRDCAICPRLAEFRAEAAVRHPGWWNAPVPGFGDPDAWLAITGLAPGMQGANRTGRPFTGDHAGTLLYATLAKFGLSRGEYAASSDDGLALEGTFITNAVRCVPPGNKPMSAEIHACRPFLVDQYKGLPNLKIIIALGSIAHQSAVKALGGKLPKTRFGHAVVHRLHTGFTIIDSYHCSRLNTNTGRLTTAMFETIFELALSHR